MHRQAAEIQPDDDGANQQRKADDARGDGNEILVQPEPCEEQPDFFVLNGGRDQQTNRDCRRKCHHAREREIMLENVKTGIEEPGNIHRNNSLQRMSSAASWRGKAKLHRHHFAECVRRLSWWSSRRNADTA